MYISLEFDKVLREDLIYILYMLPFTSMLWNYGFIPMLKKLLLSNISKTFNNTWYLQETIDYFTFNEKKKKLFFISYVEQRINYNYNFLQHPRFT